jgi:zinc D-Ala-D-Ala carboxypeptidase
MNISKYITLAEATTSQTAVRKGIPNVPNAKELENMQLVATLVFDKVREHFGKPIRVSSFFRSLRLNVAVGGSKTSQHTKGMAIDMQGTNGLLNAQIFHYIKDNLEFDQLIWEYGTNKEPSWVHVSYNKGKNRGQVLYIGVK